jgi:hypothetical protein
VRTDDYSSSVAAVSCAADVVKSGMLLVHAAVNTLAAVCVWQPVSNGFVTVLHLIFLLGT